MNIIEHTELTDKIIDLCKKGTPVIKFGNGNGPTIIVNAGTHGEELASQAAAFKLLNLLANYGDEIKGTIYVIPILFPNTTADNVKVYNGIDPNSVANINGSISNHLVNFAVDLNVDALGDFHCTRHSDLDVGITCLGMIFKESIIFDQFPNVASIAILGLLVVFSCLDIVL